MNVAKHLFLTALAGSLVWMGAATAADDDKPKAEGDKGGAHAEKGDRPKGERRDFRGGGGGPGGDVRARGDGNTPWAGGLNLGNLTGRNGGSNIVNMASRMLGVEIEDPKAQAKMIEELPLGAEKRQVVNVPIGGIDNPGGTGAGWKMESVFKLTEEQTKALDSVRSEYDTEQKKLEAEIKEQLKLSAEKVKLLRQKYELRANDVLAGDDKSSKEKMDALSKELQNKNTAIVKEVQPLFDMNDMQQGLSMIRMIREKTSTNLKDYETKLLELIPPTNRDTIAEVIRRQSEMRDQMNRWMGGAAGGNWQRGGQGNGAGNGDRPRRDGDTVKPPQPPEAEKKGDF